MPRRRKVEPAIVKILRDAWVPQQFKAAKALRREGITAQLFWEFFYRDEGANKYGLDSAWVNNTYNELRDLEREDKEKAATVRPRGRPPIADDTREYPLEWDSAGCPFFGMLDGKLRVHPGWGNWSGHDGYTRAWFRYADGVNSYADGVNNLNWCRWKKPDYQAVEYATHIVFRKRNQTKGE